MKSIIVGTAGHIDHGKTELVKALTGIDTDRLIEEKERGITIDIGFAYLYPRDDLEIGIIDVPGHERFVGNMLAGAFGMDLVILVIAADEGVMPQTKEHLAICSYLGVEDLIVAITKIDMVDKELVELAIEEAEESLSATRFKAAPIIPVSSVTHEGIDKLLDQVMTRASAISNRTFNEPFRLPIDRVFTLKGFGVIVTGTLANGSLSKGDQVLILPVNIQTTIRNLQVHGKDVATAYAGERTACNLRGVNKEQVARGHVIVQPNADYSETRLLDARISLLNDASYEIRHQQRIRVHLWTSEVMARVYLMDNKNLKRGETSYAQLKLERPVVARFNDPIIIRSYSPVTTIGGGVILDNHPRPFRRSDKMRPKLLHQLCEGSGKEKISAAVELAGNSGIELKALSQNIRIEYNNALAVAHELVKDGALAVIRGDQDLLLSRAAIDRLKKRLKDYLGKFHQRFPTRRGIQRNELLQSFGKNVRPFILDYLLTELIEGGEINKDNDYLKLPGFKINISPRLQENMKKLEQELYNAGIDLLTMKQLTSMFDTPTDFKEAAHLLLEKGNIVKLSSEYYIHAKHYNAAKDKIINYLQQRKKANVGSIRDMLGGARKATIPLLEYLDKVGITVRQGNERTLKEHID